jgi:hypothetical protein
MGGGSDNTSMESFIDWFKIKKPARFQRLWISELQFVPQYQQISAIPKDIMWRRKQLYTMRKCFKS